VAGLDLSSKLRRGLGKGKIVPAEFVAERMAAFDLDGDGALTQEELAEFLKKHRVGGPWFCDMVARTLWNFCTSWFSKDVTWIKISALAWMIHNAMKDRPRPARRYKITPESAMGYVPLEPMEGSMPVDGDMAGGGEIAGGEPPSSDGPPPRRGPGPRRGAPRRGPRPGPRGRAGPRGRPRRGPGPRR